MPYRLRNDLNSEATFYGDPVVLMPNVSVTEV